MFGLISFFLGICIFTNVKECGSSKDLYRAEDSHFYDTVPYFDLTHPNNNRNVSGVEGKTAKLTCTVRSRGDRLVSWIRRGIHPVVLSSGDITFTSDTRFSVLNPPGTDDWVLSINLARMSDLGHYECQVNTEPKINLGFWLNILPATAVIHAESSVFVKPGSTISLTCSIKLFSSPPTNIQWYKDARALNLDSARGGVSLENEKTPIGTKSTLIVTKAGGDDSGNYTCNPSSGHATSVLVHVVDGENPRASQRGLSSGAHSQGQNCFCHLVATVPVIIYLLIFHMSHLGLM